MKNAPLYYAQETAAWLFLAASLFLFALLPMAFHDIYRHALYAFFFSFVLDFAINKRWQNLRFTLSSVTYICLIAYYLLLFAFLPLEKDTTYLNTIAEYSLPFAGFSLIGLLGGFNNKFKIKHFAIVGAIFPIIYSAYIIHSYIGWANFYELGYKTSFTDYNHFMNIKINAHMGFNLFCNIELLLVYFLFKNRPQEKSRTDIAIRWFCLACCLIQIPLIVISQGRIGMLSLTLVLFYVIIDITMSKKFIMLAVVAVFAVAAVSFIGALPRFDVEQIQEYEPRNVVWSVGWENIKKSPVLGHGASTTFAIMQEDFLNADWANPEESLITNIKNGVWWGGHPHNQLMQSQLNYGIIGLLLMLAIFILPFFAMKKDRFYPLFALMWLCILMQVQTEIIQTSVSFIGFAFWLLFILSFQGDTKSIIKRKNE